MRIICKIIQSIIAIYITIFVIVEAFFITQTSIYEKEFPNVKGYSIYKVKDNNLEPDFKKNSYLFLKYNESYNASDYVYCKGKKILKILSIDKETEEVSVISSNKDESILTLDDIYAKVEYNNSTLNTTLNILTHPLTILLLIAFAIFLSSVSYKRYK